MMSSGLRFLTLPCLMVTLAACGKIVPNNPDASGIDASGDDGGVAIDAPVDAQTRGTITVNVLSVDGDGQPEAGATVLFYEPDGSLADRVLSDIDGQASAELGRGGSITVVRLREYETRFTTVLEVSPDDVITVGRAPTTLGSRNGSFRVIVPERANATSYQVQGGCSYGSGGSTAFNVNMYSCPNVGDLLGTTTVGNSLYYIGRNDVDLAASDVNLTSETWTFMPSFSLSLTAVPADLDHLGLMRETIGASGSPWSSYANLASPSAGVHTFSLRYPSGVGRATLVRAYLDKSGYRLRGQGGGGRAQILFSKINSASVSSHTIEVEPRLLPWLGEPQLDGREVSWPADGGSAPGDVMIADLQWFANTTGRWRIVAPPGTTHVTLPTLPEDFDTRWQGVLDGTFVSTAMAIASDTFGGYDNARQHGEPYVDLVEWQGSFVLADVTSGTLTVSRAGSHYD
jgi:hypothetical protein